MAALWFLSSAKPQFGHSHARAARDTTCLKPQLLLSWEVYAGLTFTNLLPAHSAL
jgi:hypothetical protein